jgi:hypothetical protein
MGFDEGIKALETGLPWQCPQRDPFERHLHERILVFAGG